MGYDAKTERLIALKKLAGKAQTSNDKGLANEGLPSGLTVSYETVFGQDISTDPASANLYDITGQVEYIRFSATFVAGSDTSDGRHGFELSLPSDYESNSSNSKAGTYPFLNSQVVNITSGSLQLVPTSYATPYEAKPYYGGSSAKDSGTQIPVLDARDWYMDYFNGIMFQQDPPGTGDHANNPDFVEGFLYVGKYLKEAVADAGGGDPNAQYLVLSATGSLSAERVFTAGTGISPVDGGAGSTYTLSVNDSVVATLTGSTFTGPVHLSGSVSDFTATGSVKFNAGLTGSLTRLIDGTSYLVGGSNISIFSSSTGQITISTGGSSLDDAPFITFETDSNLTNERVLTSSSGISISTASSGIINIDTSPSKIIYEVTSSHPADSVLIINNADFSSNNFSPSKTDIFVNGMLMLSGADKDYVLGSSKNQIYFKFGLQDTDFLTIKFN